jgi:hypothetical protein
MARDKTGRTPFSPFNMEIKGVKKHHRGGGPMTKPKKNKKIAKFQHAGSV